MRSKSDHFTGDLLQLARKRVGENRGRLGHQGIDRRPRRKLQQLGMARLPFLPQPHDLGRGRFGRGKLLGALAAGLLAEHGKPGPQGLDRGVGLLPLLVLLLPLRLQEVEIFLIGHCPAQSAQEILEGLLKTIVR